MWYRSRCLRVACALSLILAAVSCATDSPSDPGGAAATIQFASGTAIVGLLATYAIVATVYDAEFANVTSRTPLQWESSDASIASVSATGVVTGVALGGPVTITAKTGSVRASMTVRVAPERIEFSPAVPSALAVNNETRLTATPVDFYGAPISLGPVTWLSSNPAVATIDSTGLLVGRGAGTVLISASVAGRTASFGILVGVATIYDGLYLSVTGVTPSATVEVVFGNVVRFAALVRPAPDCSLSVATANIVPITANGTFSTTVGGTSTGISGTFAANGSVVSGFISSISIVGSPCLSLLNQGAQGVTGGNYSAYR